MSRVARARERAAQRQVAGRLPLARRAAAVEAVVAAEGGHEPWDLTEAVRAPGIGTEHDPARDLAGLDPAARGQLAALVRRVFLPPPAGIGARSILFRPVDGVRHAEATVRQVAALLSVAQRGRVCLVNGPGAPRPPLAGPPRASLPEAGDPALALVADSSKGAVVTEKRRWLRETCARFEYVVIGPGGAADGDCEALAPMVDGVILLVDGGATRRDAARRVADALEGAGARLLGVVVTNRPDPIPEALYRLL